MKKKLKKSGGQSLEDVVVDIKSGPQHREPKTKQERRELLDKPTRGNNQIYSSAFEEKIMTEPRTGLEMEDATKHKVPIHMYSDLCQLSKKHGALPMLANLFKTQGDQHIILLQDPQDMTSGHWFSISRNLPKREIYFFSTYGGKPDVEKISWISPEDLKKSGQDLNIVNDSFRTLQQHGWTIYYNDYPYQKENVKSATCGIYTAAFLRSGKNPDEFEKDTLKIIKSGKNPAIVFYRKYFR